MIIRPEEPRDYDGVAHCVEAAFGRADEARLVESLRAAGHHVPPLTLVADDGGAIVGHVMQSYVTLRGDDDERRVLALAPLSVTPARQRSGVGGALMRETIRLADDAGEALIVLLGHPAYYPRFGFENARALGVEGPSSFPDAAFMVRRLAVYDASYRGVAVYPGEWGIE